MKNVYLVSNVTQGKYVLQGIFEDKNLAEKFAKEFENAIIDEEFLYKEFPKLYRFICMLNLKDGTVVKLEKCTPSVAPVLLTVDNKMLYAVGETEAEAQYNAESYYKKLEK